MATENASDADRIAKEKFRKEFYEIMDEVPGSYVVGSVVDAIREYECSKKDKNEFEFILERIKKLPAEYKEMIRKEARKFNKNEQYDNANKKPIKIEGLCCAEEIVLPA